MIGLDYIFENTPLDSVRHFQYDSLNRENGSYPAGNGVTLGHARCRKSSGVSSAHYFC